MSSNQFPTPEEVERVYLEQTLRPVMQNIRAAIMGAFASMPYDKGVYWVDLGKIKDAAGGKPTGVVLRAACNKLSAELTGKGWHMDYRSDQRDGESLELRPIYRNQSPH